MAAGATRTGWGLSRAASVTVVLALLGVTAGVWGVSLLQRSQERQLLASRAAEVGLILTQATDAVPARLAAQGAVLEASDMSAAAYAAAAAKADVNHDTTAFAWLRPAGRGAFVVLASTGAGLRTGETITDERADTMARALRSVELVAGKVVGTRRVLGLALGPPAAPEGTVLYQESTLGPAVSPPRQSSTSPFSDLDVVLYATSTEVPGQVLVGTSDDVPLRGSVARRPLSVGGTTWLLTVKAERPLTGAIASRAPWFVLVAGLLATALVAAVVETVGRRRDGAIALYASERRSAEVFQRSLLPTLPDVPGLELGARYVPSAQGQRVGGDWFDVFPLEGGRVGVVIGDVMGHDLVAASAMAQVRSALRAYALQVPSPAGVLDLLDAFVTSLEVTELVTVLYGVLGPACPDGSRDLCWSNAGHLPPLLRRPDGDVATLWDGGSVVIGTPITVVREAAQVRLLPGATLLLFTDGLVEVPGGSLDDGLALLARAVSQDGDTVEGVCETALGTVPEGSRHDDVAVLAVRLLP